MDSEPHLVAQNGSPNEGTFGLRRHKRLSFGKNIKKIGSTIPIGSFFLRIALALSGAALYTASILAASTLLLGGVGVLIDVTMQNYERLHKNPEHIRSEAAKSEFCRLRRVCAAYGNDRLNCSTAFDYALCMSKRIGNASTELCQNDGTVAGPADMPGNLECFMRSLVSH